jgi:hypothetical protein
MRRRTRQVTLGAWAVRGVEHVDETARRLYFSAGGREPGDPYLRRLYSVGLDSGALPPPLSLVLFPWLQFSSRPPSSSLVLPPSLSSSLPPFLLPPPPRRT